MTDDHWIAAACVACVLGLSYILALSTSHSVPLKVAPAPAVAVTVTRPCVFLAYDPGLNAYVCLDGAAAPLPAQPALPPASSLLSPLSGGGR